MRFWVLGFLSSFLWTLGFSNVYENTSLWHQHPQGKNNPLDTSGYAIKQADVFYIHPTIRDNGHGTNSTRFHPSQTDRIEQVLWNQAYAFSESCRVYAPSYRHAFLSTLMRKDTLAKERALDTAYADIRSAFKAYLMHWNKKRPLFIASHSQGSYLALRLLEEFFENNQAPSLVAAYVIGYTVPEDLFNRVYQKVDYCTDSLQTGCIVSWRTFGKHAKWSQLEKKMYMNKYPTGHEFSLGKDILCTNPMTWNADGSQDSVTSTIIYPAPIPKFKHQSHYLLSEVKDGRLLLYFHNINAFNAPGHDLHVYDYNIFMDLVRENVKARLRAHQQATAKEN
jgi:hypothetical protein